MTNKNNKNKNSFLIGLMGMIAISSLAIVKQVNAEQQVPPIVEGKQIEATSEKFKFVRLDEDNSEFLKAEKIIDLEDKIDSKAKEFEQEFAKKELDLTKQNLIAQEIIDLDQEWHSIDEEQAGLIEEINELKAFIQRNELAKQEQAELNQFIATEAEVNHKTEQELITTASKQASLWLNQAAKISQHQKIKVTEDQALKMEKQASENVQFLEERSADLMKQVQDKRSQRGRAGIELNKQARIIREAITKWKSVASSAQKVVDGIKKEAEHEQRLAQIKAEKAQKLAEQQAQRVEAKKVAVTPRTSKTFVSRIPVRNTKKAITKQKYVGKYHPQAIVPERGSRIPVRRKVATLKVQQN